MNERILELALINRLMNYVDLETPRHYFVSADIDEEDIQLFAMYCVRDCIKLLEEEMHEEFANNPKWYKAVDKVLNEFRVKSKREEALDEMVKINQELGFYDESI